ncbi:hypothetical protein [Halosolutus gelatinilyticus]|uniref:hypothetical protein n=1 Tax=Halosolutus gelatinilyticus TaxID=2931975 RepID=UPI001FF53038|nr:hypothetical protein [Halosolutus gelatinilyticus]
MTFQPPVECPICGNTLALDRTLEDHLMREHEHREVARHVASRDGNGGGDGGAATELYSD